jgi:hypothetical protein
MTRYLTVNQVFRGIGFNPFEKKGRMEICPTKGIDNRIPESPRRQYASLSDSGMVVWLVLAAPISTDKTEGTEREGRKRPQPSHKVAGLGVVLVENQFPSRVADSSGLKGVQAIPQGRYPPHDDEFTLLGAAGGALFEASNS